MPFHKSQAVLKKVLPPKAFDELYKVACNGFDVYQSVADDIYYRLPTRDKELAFKKLGLRIVKPYTMTSRVGLSATWDIVIKIIREGVSGAFVECGVARGGIAALMSLLAEHFENKGRKTWLFDSFEGLPPQSDKDGYQKPIRHNNREANDLAEGYCLGTFEDAENLLFAILKLNRDTVLMVKGWFEDTLPKYREVIGGIAVLRLDGDWYESTRCCLENLYDNVVPHGYVIIDDYQLVGCKLAVDEFLEREQIKVNMILDANGRAYWRNENTIH